MTILRFWTVRHPRVMSLLAAAAAATVIAVGDAQPAQAYTCPPGRTTTLDDGSAAASVRVWRNCSDGRSRISGTVRDTNCDARSARLWLRFWNDDAIAFYRQETVSATNGCGTSATFAFSSTNASPDIVACVYASNGGPTASRGQCRGA